MLNFRNARTHYSNTEFLKFHEKWSAYHDHLNAKVEANVNQRPKIMSGGISDFDREIYQLLSSTISFESEAE